MRDLFRFFPPLLANRAWGAKSLSVAPEKHRFAVKIAQPELTESRKEISIALSNDKNEPAEYSVAVVDEGILQMTSFKTPDPIRRFFDSRRLDITSLETLGWTFAPTGGKTTSNSVALTLRGHVPG